MTSPASQQVPPPVAATVHIYRGLMDRATTWRVRIDASTNWAIISSGTAVSFVLSDPIHSHAVLLLVMMMLNTFLLIETRRTRYYDLWSSWVRLLESEYYAPILRENIVTMDDIWQQMIVRDMDYPHFKSSFWQMLGRRLRDNYLALNLFLIVSWLLKLLLHQRTDLPPQLSDSFINHATIGPIPGLVVIGVVILGYLTLITITLVADRQRGSSIEVMSCERMLQRLSSPAQQPVNQHPWHPRAPIYYDDWDGPTNLND